ncbi:MAG: radical SAM protein [Planctomycetota bacterium]
MLSLAATQARSHEDHCMLCEHRCGVRRNAGERGRCRATDEVRVFRHRVEWGEEPSIVPSHLFYTSGCDLRCKFCIAEANAFDPRRGTLLTSEFLREAIAWGRGRGARNLQWVGGEPTIHLPAILRVMSEVSDLPPVVWKSDFYGTPEAFDLLYGVVDVFIADFKFGNDHCAERIASVPDYIRIVTRNLAAASRRNDLIVRHLLLPNHFDCCYVPIVEWLAAFLPEARFSLRDGYLPKWRARRDPELNSMVPKSQADRARQLARDRGLQLVGSP